MLGMGAGVGWGGVEGLKTATNAAFKLSGMKSRWRTGVNALRQPGAMLCGYCTNPGKTEL